MYSLGRDAILYLVVYKISIGLSILVGSLVETKMSNLISIHSKPIDFQNRQSILLRVKTIRG